jgi:hypothetical protein
VEWATGPSLWILTNSMVVRVSRFAFRDGILGATTLPFNLALVYSLSYTHICCLYIPSGDGQMGVAGDGKKGLEKEWTGATQMAKSKTMSAKNAWGKSTGYAEKLIDEKGMDTSRAQQLENWMNQQEVLAERKQHRFMTEDYDKVETDEDWRNLSKFGVERNQEFDLNEAFGAVQPGNDLQGVIELNSRINQPKVYEFKLKV